MIKVGSLVTPGNTFALRDENRSFDDTVSTESVMTVIEVLPSELRLLDPSTGRIGLVYTLCVTEIVI